MDTDVPLARQTMDVTTEPRKPGAHRVRYYWRWHSWALPFLVAWGTSYFPTEGSGFDMSRWVRQRTLVLGILFCRMEVVLSGPLFTPEELEGG